jgi:sugar phosphate permease
LVAGTLTDRHGVRGMMSIGQVMFGLVLLAMVFTTTFAQALTVMLLMGVGRGVVLPSLSKGVSDWFPPNQRGTAMGVKQTGMPVGGLIASITLPAVGLAFGWRVAIAGVGIWILASAALTSILYRDAPVAGGKPARRAGMLAGISTVVRIRILWTLSLVSILYLITQTALMAHLALFLGEKVLVEAFPDTASRVVAAGAFLGISQAGSSFGRIFWGVVSDRVAKGRRIPVMAGIGILTALCSLATATLSISTPLWVVAFVVFAYGANALGWNGLFQALLTERVDRKYAATGVGFGMTLAQAGTVFGPPLFGFVVDTSGSYPVAWVFLSAMCFLGVVLCLFHVAEEKQVARHA